MPPETLTGDLTALEAPTKPEPNALVAPTRFVVVNGLRCAVYGAGMARYVGLHGWAGTHDTFSRFAHALPPGEALVAVDLPGYGESESPRHFDIAEQGEHVAATIKVLIDRDLVAPKFTLIGTCSGAIVATYAEQHLTRRIERLVLSEAFAYVPLYFRLFTLPVIGPLLYWMVFDNPVGRWITKTVLGEQPEGTDLTASFRTTSRRTAVGTMRALAEIDYRSLASLRTPVTLLHGSDTFNAVRDSQGLWKEIWPHADVRQIDGSGHLLLEEKPQQALEVIAG